MSEPKFPPPPAGEGQGGGNSRSAPVARKGMLGRLLRRLPLVGVVAAAAWLVAVSHGEHVLLRYRLGDRPVAALHADVERGGHVVHAEEWRYPGGHPQEQLDEIELPPGDYLVEAHALGRPGRDPRPVPLHVGRDGDHEAVIDLP